MKVVKQIYLGIDWGTHSSKWASDIITENTGNINGSGLIKSDILYHSGEVTINPSDNLFPDIERVHSLKKKIISDPFGAFWEYDQRDDIGMSLGKVMVFSICSLLGDFLAYLKKEQLSLDSTTEIEIGFSFPNWMKDKDRESRIAVNHYHEAIVVSCYLFQLFKDELPIPGKPYPSSKWKELVDSSKSNINIPHGDEIKISEMTIRKYELREFIAGYYYDNCKWRYLVESCAAGLPYLRNIELKEPPGLTGLGKLLVIDIGAGSTDIGYMLRTISIKDGTENLFYFSPAPTLPVAGDDLTKEIKDLHDSTGNTITFVEAEAFKITRPEEWLNKPFADIWRKNIGRHVKEYIKNIQDRRWLDMKVTLEIIITGGSGIVEGLSREIEAGVTEGLKERGLNESISRQIETIDKVLSGWSFRNIEEYARRAVAIGCSDSDKPSLKYKNKMDPPTPSSTYVPITRYR